MTESDRKTEPLTLYDAVRHLNPCAAAAEWLRQFDLEEAGACWEETDCGEWLWWLVSRTVKDDRVLRRLLVRFAEEVAYLHEEPDCLAAMELALAYADGDIGADEFRAACRAAWSATRNAACRAAWNATRSAAESATRSAVWNAARNAARSAAESAEDTMDRRQADIVREVVPLSLVLDGLGVRHD